jgi:hypothetical protein
MLITEESQQTWRTIYRLNLPISYISTMLSVLHVPGLPGTPQDGNYTPRDSNLYPGQPSQILHTTSTVALDVRRSNSISATTLANSARKTTRKTNRDTRIHVKRSHYTSPQIRSFAHGNLASSYTRLTSLNAPFSCPTLQSIVSLPSECTHPSLERAYSTHILLVSQSTVVKSSYHCKHSIRNV